MGKNSLSNERVQCLTKKQTTKVLILSQGQSCEKELKKRFSFLLLNIFKAVLEKFFFVVTKWPLLVCFHLQAHTSFI